MFILTVFNLISSPNTAIVLYNIFMVIVILGVILWIASVGYDFYRKVKDPEWRYRRTVERALKKGGNAHESKKNR